MRAYKEITGEYTTNFGIEISKAEFVEKGMSEDNTLVYGEIEFEGLHDIFESISKYYGGIPQGGVFYDLGSGTGKV